MSAIEHDEFDPSTWPTCEHCGGGQPVHRADCAVVTDRQPSDRSAAGPAIDNPDQEAPDHGTR